MKFCLVHQCIELSQPNLALGEAVMRGLSRLEIANKKRMIRTFISCARIEDAIEDER